MRMKWMTAAAALALSACAGQVEGPRTAPAPDGPLTVKIIGFNDFHGNLEPPKQSVDLPLGDGTSVKVPAGGAAWLAATIDSLRAKNPHHVVVSAGDMIGASPLVSSLFLDEPTILAMNLIDVDYNAVGNHEFDRGSAELLRMKQGGCDKHTERQPCRVDADFGGAEFEFLAANTFTESGETLFPGTGLKTFRSGGAEVKIGFIGMTLEATPSVVTPAGVAGLTFADEADTANALVPKLKAAGADAIVVVVHEGAVSKQPFNANSCEGISGDLLPIVDRLDPGIDVVVSGHTHNAYVCDYGDVNPARPILLTSAGQYGTLVTEIDLAFDPATGNLLSKRAGNVIVQNEGYSGSRGDVAATDKAPRFTADAEVAALVARYAAAAAPVAAEPVGRLAGSALRTREPSGESVLGRMIADAQLAATRTAAGGNADLAFMNPGGVRADLVPGADGSVTYGQVYAVQPFGNSMAVKSFTGAQLRAILEQQFASGSNSIEQPMILQVSHNVRYAYDLSKPEGQRIVGLTVNGAPVEDGRTYRVAMNNFLASGGDNFTIFREGKDPVGGLQDLEVLANYLSGEQTVTPPTEPRITNVTPVS